MKKKWLAITACVCLSLGAVSAVWAAEEKPQSEVKVLEAEDTSAEILQDSGENENVEKIPDADPGTTNDAPAIEPASDSETGDDSGNAEIPDVSEDGTQKPGNAAAATGWKSTETGWQYYETDSSKEPVKGLQKIGDKTYFFDENGNMQVGLKSTDNGTTYHYFNENGDHPLDGLGTMMISSWADAKDGSTYYLDENGNPLKGWATSLGKWSYYFDLNTGKMLKGRQTIDSKLYYFKATGTLGGTKGAMLTGWNQIGGQSYYFKASGAAGVKGQMFTGFKTIGGKVFYFSENDTVGAMATGWYDLGSKSYYFKQTGAYGVKGQMYLGWKTIGGKIFYFQKGGAYGNRGQMYTGWRYLDGKVFYFQKGGAKANRGRMYTGWAYMEGKVFYFKPTGGYGTRGARQTGWMTLSGKKYYFKTSGGYGITGGMYTGFQKIGGQTYYFKQSGAYGVKGQMLKGWQKISSSWYYFQSSGAMATKWMRYNGQWYYLNPSGGKMLKGWNYIDSYKFYFRPNSSGGPVGSLVQDVSSMVKGPYYATVDRVRNVVTIYAKDESGKYRIPVKAMTCSVGLPGTATPSGTFNTTAKYRWKELMGPSWGQYATRIVGGVLFHSVAGSAPNPYALPAGEYNRLGSPASHGCVRLCVRDAKWIYDNCSIGMTVKIGDNLYLPFDKPATILIPPSQNWDPTDPNI